MKEVNEIRTEFQKFKFYGIIQGRNIEEYKQWFNIIKEAKSDGYCVKTPNNNPISLVETCCFVYDNIDTPIHFLGVGNISKSILLIYFSNFFKNKISFDSSSYDLGTRYRTYLVPMSVNITNLATFSPPLMSITY